jgi:hypothetical protein
VARVPVDADNYGGLTAKKGHLLYVVGPAFYYGRLSTETHPFLLDRETYQKLAVDLFENDE